MGAYSSVSKLLADSLNSAAADKAEAMLGNFAMSLICQI